MGEELKGFDDWSDVAIDESDIIEDSADEVVEEADQQTEADVSEEEAHETDEGAQSGETDQSFKLKYLGAEREVTRDEVITYAQKGMDYDRIKGKYTEAQTALSEATKRLETFEADMSALDALKALAASQNIEFTEFVMQSVAAVEAAKNGTNINTELPRVRLDYERKAFEKQKADWDKQKNGKAVPKPTNADEEMQAEIDEFTSTFPEAAADAKAIPQEVWAAKNAEPKKSLAQHYKEYLANQKDAEIERLKAQLAQAEQNTINKYRSTGQQDSAGSGSQGDAWDRAWASL